MPGGGDRRERAPARGLYAGPMAIDGDELCTLGSVDGAITVFGTALLFVDRKSVV